MKKFWKVLSMMGLAVAVSACVVEERDDDDDDDDRSGEIGTPGGETPPGETPPGAQPTMTQLAVGAWAVEGTVDTSDGPLEVRYGWYLCPDQRMYGFTELGGFTFLDKGSYTVNDAAQSVHVTYRSKDTVVGDTYGPDTATLQYDPAQDILTFTDCCFGAPLYRIPGEVLNSDCDPGW